jgi:hypothetical protein
MSDWAAVVLVLGLCALAVAVYGVRAMVGVRAAVLNVGSLRSSLELQAAHGAALDKRLAGVEAMLKLDGKAIMLEAAKKSIPAFMR